MTTGELIALLKTVDPDGSTPVCVANDDIYFVDRMPAYYDGALEQLVHDPALVGKRYSVVGARVVRSGDKVKIVTHSIEEALLDSPDLPVDDPSGYYKGSIERWRQQGRER